MGRAGLGIELMVLYLASVPTAGLACRNFAASGVQKEVEFIIFQTGRAFQFLFAVGNYKQQQKH